MNFDAVLVSRCFVFLLEIVKFIPFFNCCIKNRDILNVRAFDIFAKTKNCSPVCEH